MSKKNQDTFQTIHANIIIPGRGDPIKNGIVIIKNNLIDYVGKDNSTYIYTSQNQTSYSVPVLMPGLWEAHAHFFGTTNIAMKNHSEFMQCLAIESSELAVTRSAQQAKMALNAGYINVREVGGYGVYLKKLINEGTIEGPNIYPCGKALSQTAGHGDHHNMPLQYSCNCIQWSKLCDGVDECIKAVRENIRMGADCIKMMASGGAATIIDPIHITQFNINEWKAIINEANRNQMTVAAHAHGRDAIERCIELGVTTIEHATSLDDNLAQKMVEKGCYYVPTIWAGEFMLNRLDSVSSDISKLITAVENSKKALKCAIKNGVTIIAGTDVGIVDDVWGNNAREIQLYVDAGMTTLQAIECITANGPLSVGRYKCPLKGQIKVGHVADILGLSSNPLDDLSVLQNEKNIGMIWKGGKIVKNYWYKNGIPIIGTSKL
eukprot:219192_1